MDDRIEPLLRPLPRRPASERVREWLVWFGAGRLVAVSLSVLAIGAGGYWLLRQPADPVESSLPRATTTTAAASASGPSDTAAAGDPRQTTTAPSSPIVVHVAGHVVAPGVYTLAPGSRVVDAVAAAGGVSDTAQPDAINLAEPLHDGDRVYLPGEGDDPVVAAGVTPAQTAPAEGDVAVASGPVDLNTATDAQLDALPGVGPSTAAAIVAHREANGPFVSVDDLDAVRGIGPSKLAALRDLVTV